MRLSLAIILFISFAMLSIGLRAQSISDSIEINKEEGEFFQNGKKLTPRKMEIITSVNSQAAKEMTLARRNKGIGDGLAIVGGALIGWTLGSVFIGDEISWEVAGIGACFVVLRFPFINSYLKHATKAAEIFNAGLKQTGRNSIDLRLGLTANGVGLILNF